MTNHAALNWKFIIAKKRQITLVKHAVKISGKTYAYQAKGCY